jgi:hypothetical protein
MRREITSELGARLLQAFREHGANYSVVARHCDCDYRLARRAYLNGFPEQGVPFRAAIRPIWRVLEEEGIPLKTAAKKRIRKPPAPPAPATPAAPAAPPPPPAVPTAEILPPGGPDRCLKVGELEERLVKSTREALNGFAAGRNAALGLISEATQILVALKPQLDGLKLSVQQQIEDANGPSVERIAKTLSSIAGVLAQAVTAQKQLVEAEKLTLGSPTSIVGLIQAPPAVSTPPSDVTESQRLLEALWAVGGTQKPALESEYVPESGGGEDEDKDDE